MRRHHNDRSTRITVSGVFGRGKTSKSTRATQPIKITARRVVKCVNIDRQGIHERNYFGQAHPCSYMSVCTLRTPRIHPVFVESSGTKFCRNVFDVLGNVLWLQ